MAIHPRVKLSNPLWDWHQLYLDHQSCKNNTVVHSRALCLRECGQQQNWYLGERAALS